MSDRVVINSRGYPVGRYYELPMKTPLHKRRLMKISDLRAGGTVYRDLTGLTRATAGGYLR